MIPLKTEDEVQKMREVCRMAAIVLDKMCKMIEVGVNTYDVDQAGYKFMKELGCKSACYNYKGGRHSSPYPAYTCISVNNEVVHGIGNLKTVLRAGDNVSIDVVVSYDGFIGDNARTVVIEPASADMMFLVKSTEEALYHAIDHARPNNRVGDISNAVQKFIESRNLSVVREFVGHGVGRSMHEEPQVPNFGKKGKGDLLKAGMTIAVEPMVNVGCPEIFVGSDGWTAQTRDGKPAAHFEHTILITSEGPDILTLTDDDKKK